MMFDLLIVSGEIIDGSGNQSFKSDIGIRNGKIESIAPSIGRELGRNIIDAAGLKVCPGFINIHSHTDTTILINPRAESKIRQGITTEVVGNCGFSAGPVRDDHFQDLMDYLVNTVALSDKQKSEWNWRSQWDYMLNIADHGTSVNLASLVGHGTIRVAVMGFDKRPPSTKELSQMLKLLEDELDKGILGFSTGLPYDPASFATQQELVELASLTASKGGIYSTHMKSEGKYLLESLAQSIKVAEKSGVSLQIAHLKAANRLNWGKIEEALKVIDRARVSGINVDFDLYPYTASGSGLIDLVPPWARDRGVSKLVELLKNPVDRRKILSDMELPEVDGWQNPLWNAPPSSIRIASVKSNQNKEFEGLNLEELSLRFGSSTNEAVLELLAREDGAVKMISFSMSEDDMIRIMKHPRTIFCTDGRAVAPYGPLSAGKIHPRYYGAFPRILGYYVRERRVLPLVEAVKKMSYLSAQKLNLHDRGLLREGYCADVAILDGETVKDLATFDDPHRYPVGIEYVIVNGSIVVSRGEHTGALPGRILGRRAGASFSHNTLS